jgi:hypothetical protein
MSDSSEVPYTVGQVRGGGTCAVCSRLVQHGAMYVGRMTMAGVALDGAFCGSCFGMGWYAEQDADRRRKEPEKAVPKRPRKK